MAAAPAEGRTKTSPDALAAASAAILGRLWGAFAREPIPGVARRGTDGGMLTVTLADGTLLRAAAATARPFAVPPVGFCVDLTPPGQAAPRPVTAPGDLVRAIAGNLGRHAHRLAAELDDSVANLARARAAQPDPDGGAPMLARALRQADPLAWLEQSVVDGHPLHPCARTRMGLSGDEVRRYAPEHRPVVMLRRVTVPEGHWYGVNRPPVLLVHPFQYDRWCAQLPWLSRVDEELPARPLMSLRTLALVSQPRHHVKTAVDIQMTSATRTVSPASIHNGFLLSRLLAHLGVPGLAAALETGGGAVLVDGEPDRRLAVAHRLVRDTPPGEVDLPLAALTAPSPATGAPLIAELTAPPGAELTAPGGGPTPAARRRDPMAFVTGAATMLLRAVLGCLRLGIALEAHGQNLIGWFRDGTLVGLEYRDWGGARVSARRLAQHGIEPPPLLGDVPTDDPEVLRTKAFASAVSTVLAELIAVLGRETGLDEEAAWHTVAAVARGLDGPDTRHLFGATLPLKAMTAMRLADRPTDDLWCAVPNPMAGLG